MNVHTTTTRLTARIRSAVDRLPIRRSVIAACVGGLALAATVSVAGSHPNSTYWGSALGDEHVYVEAGSRATTVNVLNNTPVPGLNGDLKAALGGGNWPGAWVQVSGDSKFTINVADSTGPGDFTVDYTVTGVDPDTGKTHRSHEVVYVHVVARGAAEDPTGNVVG